MFKRVSLQFGCTRRTQEKQESFYKSIVGLGAAALRTHAEEYLESRTVEETFAEGGQFLPLSVWGTQGFCVKDIEEKTGPCDIQMHNVLGPRYRVRIKSAGTAEKRNMTRQSKLGAKVPRAALHDDEDPAAIGASTPPLAILDKPDSSSSDVSDSDSSSSPAKKKKDKKRSKKRSKKEKKNKKDKKDKKDGREEIVAVARTRRIAAQPSTSTPVKCFCNISFSLTVHARSGTDVTGTSVERSSSCG